MEPSSIRTVAVVGAGTMGHSIAQSFAQRGYAVFLHDLSEDALARAKKQIAAGLRTEVAAGALKSAEVAASLDRITTTTVIEEACAHADFVTEAVTENRDTKKDMFALLDRVCPPQTILASNTSMMDIFKFVETKRPQKVLITHWFVPAAITPLVEVVCGPQTSQEAVSATMKLLRDIGKSPICITRFLPGFIGNRLQMALTHEFLFLIDNGYATPEDIEIATKASLACRMPILGVIKHKDVAGLDQIQRSLRNGLYEPPPKIANSPTLDRLVSEGRLGVKSGRGFLDYGNRSTEEIMIETNTKLIRLREFLKELKEL